MERRIIICDKCGETIPDAIHDQFSTAAHNITDDGITVRIIPDQDLCWKCLVEWFISCGKRLEVMEGYVE